MSGFICPLTRLVFNFAGRLDTFHISKPWYFYTCAWHDLSAHLSVFFNFDRSRDTFHTWKPWWGISVGKYDKRRETNAISTNTDYWINTALCCFLKYNQQQNIIKIVNIAATAAELQASIDNTAAWVSTADIMSRIFSSYFFRNK